MCKVIDAFISPLVKELHGRELTIPKNHFASTFSNSNEHFTETTGLTGLLDKYIVTDSNKTKMLFAKELFSVLVSSLLVHHRKSSLKRNAKNSEAT